MAQGTPPRSGGRLLAILAILFLGIGALALLSADWRIHDAVLVLWGAVPSSVALWNYAYQRIERHRLAVNRAVFWVTNPESTWGLTAELFTSRPLADVHERANEVLRGFGHGATRLSETADVSVWQINGSTVRVSGSSIPDPHGGEEVGVIRIEFPPTPRSFRAWGPAIRDTVTVVVDRVVDAVRPDRQKYVVDVGFPGANPYFGLFVTSVGQAAVTAFQIDFVERRAHADDLVRVRKDRLELVTSSMHSARELSLYYLALKEVPA